MSFVWYSFLFLFASWAKKDCIFSSFSFETSRCNLRSILFSHEGPHFFVINTIPSLLIIYIYICFLDVLFAVMVVRLLAICRLVLFFDAAGLILTFGNRNFLSYI